MNNRLSRLLRTGTLGAAFTLSGLLAACGDGPESEPIPAGEPLTAAEIDDDVLADAGDYSSDWLSHGRTYAETRFSPLDRIDGTNVADLGLAWSFETGTQRGLEATPIVVGGTVYTTGSWSIVYALDARTGEELWRWDPGVDRARYGVRACCDVVNRGVAVYEGRVYVGVLDGRLVALDAGTGEPVWETLTVDASLPYTITGAPRVVKGNVIIGNGGAEYGVRGYLSAYDAESGEMAWRFHTVPGDPSEPFESAAMERAAETWTGTWWEVGGGGTVWDSFAYDPDLDLLYAGTGNGSPWNRQIRSPGGGDNLYISSILALDPDTGELAWHYQTTPGETWDFTATQHMILADLEIDGEDRPVLMQAPKNGFFYVLDRETGELISAEPFVPVTWASHVDLDTGRPVEVPGARYEDEPIMLQPGPLGAHNWHPMSFSPETGLVYIPAQENWFGYTDVGEFEYRPEAWNTGVRFGAAGAPPESPTGHLLAWDPVAQQERWRVPYADMWNGGTMATAGGLVFQGTSDGRFVAYDAQDGTTLWETTVGGGVIAPPVTYEVDGTQYVAVMAGWGGSYGTTGGGGGRPALPGRMLAFALGGSGEITGTDPAALEPPEPIGVTASADEIEAGASLYTESCSVCHGPDAVSGGVLPDLRYSAPEVFSEFEAIVLEGARADRGMPSFSQSLTSDDVSRIRAYILDRRSDIQQE